MKAEHHTSSDDAEGELFRLLVENVQDYAIFVVDPQGRVRTWNPGAERLLGYRRGEIVGQSADVFFIPEDREAGVPQQEMREALDSGRGNDDRWHLRKDGTRFWSSGMMTPLWDEKRTLRGFAKIMRDRTDWKFREEQERLQQQLLDTVGQAVIATTPDGTIFYWNRFAETLYGWSQREVAGKNVMEVTVPQAQTASAEAIMHQMTLGQSWSGEFLVRRKDGSTFPAFVTTTPLVDERGTVKAFVGVSSDISQRRQADDLLRHSEERFRSLMEQAPFSIQVFSPDGRTIRVNRAWEELWGVRFEQIEGYNILEDRQLEARGVLHFIHQGFAGQSVHVPAIEYNPNETIPDITQHDDPCRWLSAVIYPIKDADGQVREVVLIHEDITARHRAETNLRDARSRLDAALKAGAIVTWTWDIPGNRLFADSNLARLFNLPPSEADGGLLDRYIESIHPDDWGRVSAALDGSVKSGRDYEADYRIMQADGSVRWVTARGRVEQDQHGRPVRMPGVLVDITERKRLEEELRVRVEQLAEANHHKEELLASLRESEEKLRLLADTIPQLAWMARPDGHIFWYNRRWYEYTGTSPEGMEGWGWQTVHDPDVLPNVLERWNGAIASGDPFDMVFPLRGADDQFRPFLTRVNPLRDEAGRILYWFGTNTDISEIKRMEEALRDADRRKDEFLATLAHELRNPLAPIRNSLQILKMPRVDAEMARQTREMMERQVHHLVRLVDDLLDVSRVMRGKIELRREPVELATVVARAVETAKPLIEVQAHRLEISLPPESLLVDADPVRLAQVVGNLLTNAAKYTEANGQIWLAAQRDGDDVVLKIRDTGIGIAPDMLPHVFELFVQVDHASAKAQGGLGIGLTLVKNLVEMHGGTVEAHSAGLGKGCEFVVRLPLLLEERQEPIDEGNGSQQQYVSSSGHRLMVVDDNKDAAVSLAMLLRLQGHEVRVVHDGVSALELANDYLPALIFLDIGMPGMDGFEVASRVRQTPGMERTVLVALTGWGQQEDRRRTAEAGFHHHLVKPPEPKAVEGLIAGLKDGMG